MALRGYVALERLPCEATLQRLPANCRRLFTVKSRSKDSSHAATKHSDVLPRLDGTARGRVLSRNSMRSLSTLSDNSSSLRIASNCCCSAGAGSTADLPPSEVNAKSAHDRENNETHYNDKDFYVISYFGHVSHAVTSPKRCLLGVEGAPRDVVTRLSIVAATTAPLMLNCIVALSASYL